MTKRDSRVHIHPSMRFCKMCKTDKNKDSDFYYYKTCKQYSYLCKKCLIIVRDKKRGVEPNEKRKRLATLPDGTRKNIVEMMKQHARTIDIMKYSGFSKSVVIGWRKSGKLIELYG